MQCAVDSTTARTQRGECSCRAAAKGYACGGKPHVHTMPPTRLRRVLSVCARSHAICRTEYTLHSCVCLFFNPVADPTLLRGGEKRYTRHAMQHSQGVCHNSGG